MAAESRKRTAGLAATLLTRPQRFAFFQAVRLLRLLRRKGGVAERDDRPVAARFRSPDSLAFPVSPVRAIAARKDSDLARPEAPEMEVAVMGLVGPAGVLPRHYTEHVVARRQLDDEAGHAFFDLIGHRFVELFYLAWERTKLDVRLERGDTDRAGRYLLDVAGLGTRGLAARLDTPGTPFRAAGAAYFAGLLNQQPRSARGLEQVLGELLGAPVAVRQLAGQWLSIPEPQRGRLGRPSQRRAARRGGPSVLGGGAVVGTRTWDRQSGLEIRVGPLSKAAYRQLVAGGRHRRPADQPALQGLKRFLDYYLGTGIQVRLRLVMEREGVPRLALPAGGDPEGPPPILGVATWLTTAPPEEHPDRALLRL